MLLWISVFYYDGFICTCPYINIVNSDICIWACMYVCVWQLICQLNCRKCICIANCVHAGSIAKCK